MFLYISGKLGNCGYTAHLHMDGKVQFYTIRPLPLLLGQMPDLGLEKVIISSFLSLQTEKHLMKQKESFK